MGTKAHCRCCGLLTATKTVVVTDAGQVERTDCPACDRARCPACDFRLGIRAQICARCGHPVGLPADQLPLDD